MSGDDVQFDPSPTSEADLFQFGEVQHRDAPQAPPPLVPPDADGHYAVRRVARRAGSTRAATDVFVDLDTMLEMQEHAAEDTSVELGGILLGRRGTREDGSPYVIIHDALRARHYRATRGSFTFTHETWADLNQRRGELPETTEIVGWYHTHPGWGVFLSDLDVFICDHFFSHPDDVALVIDPTSGDTGLFVRRETPPGRAPRRLDHYYLHAHRTRADSLDTWASYFSGANTMANPPAVFPGRTTPPVILAGGDSGASTPRYVALVGGMLGGQMLLVALLVYLVATRPAPVPIAQPVPEVAVRERVVDDLVDRLSSGGVEGLGQSYRELATASAHLKAANVGLLGRVEQLEKTVGGEQTAHAETRRKLEGVRRQLDVARDQIAAAAAEKDDETSTGVMAVVGAHWIPFALGAGLGAVVAAAGAVGWSRRRGRENLVP